MCTPEIETAKEFPKKAKRPCDADKCRPMCFSLANMQEKERENSIFVEISGLKPKKAVDFCKMRAV